LLPFCRVKIIRRADFSVIRKSAPGNFIKNTLF